MAQVLSFDFLALHYIYYSEIMPLFYDDFAVQNTALLHNIFLATDTVLSISDIATIFCDHIINLMFYIITDITVLRSLLNNGLMSLMVSNNISGCHRPKVRSPFLYRCPHGIHARHYQHQAVPVPAQKTTP